MYETILFDLDGTLTDSGLGITNAAMYALERMGYPVPPRQELYQLIGPPLLDSFQRLYGMDEKTALEAEDQFRIYYNRQGIFENLVYKGVPEMLERLSKGGCHLVVATSKPEVQAKRVVAHFGLDKYIRHIAGATLDASRCRKDLVIGYALQEFGINPASAVMVGDREHDIIGGKGNGLPGIGVAYGYGSREELETAGATAIADSPKELGDILLGE